MAKNRNTFQKGQREQEKKRKAQSKREDKRRKKEQPAPAEPPIRDRFDEEPTTD